MLWRIRQGTRRFLQAWVSVQISSAVTLTGKEGGTWVFPCSLFPFRLSLEILLSYASSASFCGHLCEGPVMFSLYPWSGYPDPLSSFFVLSAILARLFCCVVLNPIGFHIFPQCLNFLIIYSKSSLLSTAAGVTASSLPVICWGFCSDAFFSYWET